MNRRQLLGMTLGGVIAATTGAKAGAATPDTDPAPYPAPDSGRHTHTVHIPALAQQEEADANRHMRMRTVERAMLRDAAPHPGPFVPVARDADPYRGLRIHFDRWEPGKVERLPADFTTGDAPIDENHIAVRFMPKGGEVRRVVLVDGARVRGVTEAYANEQGWVIRYVPHPVTGLPYLENDTIVEERVFGAVQVLPQDGA